MVVLGSERGSSLGASAVLVSGHGSFLGATVVLGSEHGSSLGASVALANGHESWSSAWAARGTQPSERVRAKEVPERVLLTRNAPVRMVLARALGIRNARADLVKVPSKHSRVLVVVLAKLPCSEVRLPECYSRKKPPSFPFASLSA